MKKIIAILLAALALFSTSCSYIFYRENVFDDETTAPPETTTAPDVPSEPAPEFEAYMNINGLSEDAKAFFRAAKEKSGYSIVDRTLTVENGTITADDDRPIDNPYNEFRAVYGEGTAELMEYVDAVREIGYWFVNPGALSPDPMGKIETLYNRYHFAPIEIEAFEENNIHDPASLRAFLETKFTDRVVDQLMKGCGDGIGDVEIFPPIAYYEGKLYAYVTGQHPGDLFAAEFFIKENTRDRVSVICRKKASVGGLDRDTDYEIVFVREGDKWLCDYLPNIWQNGAGKVSTTRAAYIESYEISNNIDTSELLANAQSHHYEEYPGCNSVPYSAVLWQDGVSTYIDVNDPRLIMLVNMYHNSVYNSKYSWTQGCLDNAMYQKYVYAPVRLELTFKWEGGAAYDKHDKIVISCPEGEALGGGFVVIDPDGETYTDAPCFAMIRFPYSMHRIDWLQLVGFVE